MITIRYFDSNNNEITNLTEERDGNILEVARQVWHDVKVSDYKHSATIISDDATTYRVSPGGGLYDVDAMAWIIDEE